MAKSRNHILPRFVFILILSLAMLACRTLFPAERQSPAETVQAFTPSPLPATSQATLPGLATEPAGTGVPATDSPATGAPTPTAAGQAAALLPEAQGDLQAIRGLANYHIQVDINMDELTFAGRARVEYTNTESVALGELNFRLFPNGGKSYGNGSLMVTEASLDGQSVQTQLSLENTVLELQLTQELAPGEQAQIDLGFAGVVPRDFGGDQTPEGYGIYNYSQGVLALAGWYPILAVYDEQGWNLDPVSGIGDSVYADMAFYSVEVSLPSHWVLAATGVETSRSTENAFTSYQLISGPVREFFMIASADFQVESQSAAGTMINSFYLPGSQTGGQIANQVAAEALQVFNDKFGRYPYNELDVVQVPMRYAAGVEFPGIILIASNLYRFHAQPFFLETLAHEVAHQWWYNLVGNDVFEHPWMDEALTTYSSAIYFQNSGAPELYRDAMENYQSEYEQAVNLGYDEPVAAGLAHFESLEQSGGVYGAIVYAKGALFFRAVREEIGDEAFFQALQDYFQTFKYQIARPEDLLGAFETASGRQLEALYQEWLY